MKIPSNAPEWLVFERNHEFGKIHVTPTSDLPHSAFLNIRGTSENFPLHIQIALISQRRW